MNQPRGPARPPSWPVVIATVLGLNLVLSFHNVWPTPWVTTRYEVSVEAAAVVLLVTILVARVGPLPRWALRVLAAVVVVLALGRYAEVTAPAIYGRRINLYWDAQHIPGVVAMLAEAASWWQVLVALLVFTAGLALLFLFVRAMLGVVSRASDLRPTRLVLMAASSVIVVMFALAHLAPPLHLLRLFSLPVSMTYAEQFANLGAVVSDDGSLNIEATELPATNLAGLDGADVLVLFLESYGATAYDEPRYFDALANAREALSGAIVESGRTVLSARVESPTFGGASWLAHSSFLSGIDVADHRLYDRLLTKERDTWVQRFSEGQYRTLALMPGMRQAWPEGQFYGFDRIYDAAAIDYRGPEFGWWRIPDQYSLARLDESELSPRERPPVMAVFTTITTHAPFRPVPPYQPDWSRVLGPSPFDGRAVEKRLGASPTWSDPGADYVAAFDYSLRCIAGYLRARAPRDLVLIIVGDHQPIASVSGRDAPWDVPVHVVLPRDSRLGQTLREVGFHSGLDQIGARLGQMHELSARLLASFGGAD